MGFLNSSFKFVVKQAVSLFFSNLGHPLFVVINDKLKFSVCFILFPQLFQRFLKFSLMVVYFHSFILHFLFHKIPGDQEGLFKLAVQLRTFFHSVIYNTATGYVLLVYLTNI
jgi:hypothetical protein